MAALPQQGAAPLAPLMRLSLHTHKNSTPAVGVCTIFAGFIQSKYGAQFVTWDWSFDRKGVCHGHYYTGLYSSGNYDAVKRDFAVRSGLIPKQQLFREEQLIEIYRCCTDTLQGGFELSYDQEKTIQEVRKQIEECLPDIMERIQQQDAEPTQEQTM